MTANARVEVGKPGRGTTSDVVEYTGAEKRLSLIEDLDGNLLLNVGVTTTEKNTTEKRPNYRIDIQIPVDGVVARFLSNALERAEEVELREPDIEVELTEAELNAYSRAGGAPLEEPVEAELLEVDGEIITFGEVRDFRGVVPGGMGGILPSEVEAFRRYRAQVEEKGFVGALEDDFVKERLAEAEEYAGETRELPDGADTAEHTDA